MRAVRSSRSKFSRPSSPVLKMRAAVMVVAPMPSPRKKMMFFAWGFAAGTGAAWAPRVKHAATSSAESRMVVIWCFLAVPWFTGPPRS
jgi:hypothetical protein